MSTVNGWLNEPETSYLVSDKVSVAELAVFQQLKQVLVFGDVTIDEGQFGRLAEWYSWIDENWDRGALKGRD